MEASDAELIAQLSTRIGMIMEDMSVVALTLAAQDQEGRDHALQQLEDASTDIPVLVAAMRCVMKRQNHIVC